ncbi:putative E3 ubiquitin-protein ligase [Nymphaea thermarum]|nr:putative E3 ubiquitin-protein ligase [Nymphaea thermarum]
MGLSSLPAPSEGVLSVILVNTVLSIAIFKEILRSILQIVGIRLDPAFSESDDDIPSGTISMEPLPPYAEDIRDRISSVVFESIGCAHDTECAVCLTRFEPESAVSRLSCGHFFHKPCFDKWLDYWHSTCPLCRSSLMPEDECW